MQESVSIVDVAPRDGLQNEAKLVPTAMKTELISRLVDAGVRRIEATSFAHPRLVPQMADAEALLGILPVDPAVSYSALVLNRRGFERAAAAGVGEINVVLLATDEFSRRNQGVTTREGLEALLDIVALAYEAGIAVVASVSAAFGCPFEGEVPLDHVIDLVERVGAAAPKEIVLADTIGVAVPRQVQGLIAAARQVTDVPLRCHFHNTRNTGYANALSAYDAGVRVFDASAGGIGGCPFAPAATGNIATEDLVYAFERSGIDTGIDLESMIETGQWLVGELGQQPIAMLDRAGAFPKKAL